MTQEQRTKIEKIIQLAQANNVDFNAKFPTLMNAASYASQDLATLADLAYEIVTEIFSQGFERSKFDMQMNGDVKYITKLWATFIEPRSVAKCPNLLKELNSVKVGYMSRRESKADDLRDMVNRCIEDTLAGIEVAVADEKSALNSDVLDSGRAKLMTLKSKLVDICDVVSLDANEFAKEVIGYGRAGKKDGVGIVGWREKIYSQLLTVHDEQLLDNAINAVDRWQDTLRIPNKKKLSKNKEKLEYVREDSLDNLLKLPKVRASAEQFFNLLSIKGEPDEELMERRSENEELSQNISKIDDTLAELANKYAKGMMGAEDFVAKCEMYETDKALLQQELDNNRMLFSQIEQQNALFNQLIKKYELLKHYYKFFEKRSPHYFIEIFSGIDYNRFIDILNGVSITSDSFQSANAYIEAVLTAVTMQTEQLARESAGFDEILNAHKARPSIKLTPQQREQHRENTLSKAEELMKKHARQVVAEPSEEIAKQEEEQADKINN